jgi:(R,R)-butanediol dehydrogenase/meso-butanediol dehydrogenase/diacetyl reductase
MKAAVYKGNQRMAIEEIPTPEPGPGQILVKVGYSAICGTDVHTFLYDIAPPGSVMGHEFCGTVDWVGSGESKWKVGDRVIGGGGTPPPGHGFGLRATPRYKYRTMGFSDTRIRAYAEYTVMEEWEPMLVPDNVSDEAAAMCEPLAVAVHAVRVSQLKMGDYVGVLGAGPIGLLCLQAAKAAGASGVFVSEPSPARREAALAVGADAVIDPITEDVEARMVSLTGGLGPRVVFECAAAKSTLDQGLNLVARNGQVVLIALAWEPTAVLPVDWVGSEVTLLASMGTRPEDWRIAMELIASEKVDMAPLLSDAGFIPLEGIQEAFESLVKPTTQLQIVVKL